MKVFKRSGSSYYAYKFQYRGKEYYRSAGTGNRREAEAIAAAARARIVRQAAGLEEPEPQRKSSASDQPPKGIPTLREFQTTFVEWVATAKAPGSMRNGLRAPLNLCDLLPLWRGTPVSVATRC